jgi:hypothetical protein
MDSSEYFWKLIMTVLKYKIIVGLIAMHIHEIKAMTR